MSLIIKQDNEREVTLKYVQKLIANTNISFAAIGICGGALFADNIGLGFYEILAVSFIGLLASIIASDEVRI